MSGRRMSLGRGRAALFALKSLIAAVALSAGLAQGASAEKANAPKPETLIWAASWYAGRANIARDGSVGRAKAEEDALQASRRLMAAGFTSLLVDTSPRPNPSARRSAWPTPPCAWSPAPPSAAPMCGCS